MKLRLNIPRVRAAGILLLECVVYIGVLTIILGLGGTAFYLCWDNARDFRRTTDDIAHTMRAGERWRADIRHATGQITVETDPDGQLVRIPFGTDEVLYAFTAGAVGRKLLSADRWTTILLKVKTSSMEADDRTQVKAWRWDVELVPVRAKTGLRPLFTFEAVPPVAP